MPLYSYQGKMADGSNTSGSIDAGTEVEARVKLRAQRIIPIKVVPMRQAGARKDGGNLLSYFGIQPGVKSKDLQIFTRQLSTMITSGIPIVQCLDILIAQTSSPVLKSTCKKVKESVEGGKRLADSLEGYPNVFNRLYVSLVRAGEEGGVLDTILNRLAQYIEKSVKIKNKIVGAMWYPVGIIAVATIVIIGMLTFVIPKFEKLFSQAGKALPYLTQVVVDASHFLQAHFMFMIGCIVGTIFAAVKYYQTPSGKQVCDEIFIRIPIFGSLLQKGAIARFTRTLSTMLSCGVGIIDSLEICSQVVGSTVLEKALRRAKVSIAEGKSITVPLSAEKFIPPMVTQMIGVGEATGSLDTMLSKIADFYEEEVDYAVGALTSIMEPIMMVILGGIIAVLVVAMYLPIFDLASAVTG